MAADQTIPDFIAAFMKQPVSKGTPDASLVALYEKLGQADPQANTMSMNQWLTLQLPEVMQITIDSGKGGAEAWRDTLASTVQDEAISNAMRKTHLETGDLDRSLPVWKEKKKFIPSSVQPHTVDQALQCADDQKNQFANTLQYKTFLQDELLPLLQVLQRGDQPTNAHKAVLDIAVDGNEAYPIGFVDFCAQMFERMNWHDGVIPHALPNDGYKGMKDFFTTLRNYVKQVIVSRREPNTRSQGELSV